MNTRVLATLIATFALASLAACSPGGNSIAGPESSASAPTARTADTPATPPAPTLSEADTRTRDELLAGREVAPAIPGPEAPTSIADTPSSNDLAAKERELPRRERDLRTREARAAAAAKPVTTEAPTAPANEPEATETQDAEPTEGREPADDFDRESVLEPEPEPEPELAHAPAATVPSGERVAVELLGGLSSVTSQAGDTFRVRVAGDIRSDGEIAIPAGSEIHGLVAEASSARAQRGQPAKLVLKFTDLVLPTGETVPLQATIEELGASHPGRKAATVGGGAAAGAVLGRVLAGSGSRGKGTVIGAIVGAIAGAAIASRTAESEIEIPAGTLFNLRLDRAIEIGGGAR